MFVTFTECAKNKKIAINLDNVTHIVEHEIAGTVFHFETGQVRVEENLNEVLRKVKCV